MYNMDTRRISTGLVLNSVVRPWTRYKLMARFVPRIREEFATCLTIPLLGICLGTKDVLTQLCGTLGDDSVPNLLFVLLYEKSFLSNPNEFTIFEVLSE